MSTDQLPPGEVTRLLQAWSQGDQSALDRLTPIVYAELHRQARYNLNRERPGHLLQPSALVNEAFVRLIDGAPVEWANRTHFFASFARLMRRILVDFARAQETGKRGSRSPHVDLSEAVDRPGATAKPVRFLDLDAALDDLSRFDERQARVVELRYFGGLDSGEVAEVMGISIGTVNRDWRRARAFLYSRLQPAGQPLS